MSRELLGRLGTTGWRPYVGWGLGTALIALAFAFVYRFFIGTISGADFVALAAVVLPFCQFMLQRSLLDKPREMATMAMGPGAAAELAGRA